MRRGAAQSIGRGTPPPTRAVLRGSQSSWCVATQLVGHSMGWSCCAALWCAVQVPDDIVFLDEIPHNATGKVSKLTLRQMFKDYKPAQSKL